MFHKLTIFANTTVPYSECSHNMLSEITLFEDVALFKAFLSNLPCVIIDNGTTTLFISNYIYMNYIICGKRIRRIEYYISNLSTILFSIKQHIQYQGCFFHAEDNKCILAFPSAILDTDVWNGINFPIEGAKHRSIPFTFDQDTAFLSSKKNTTTLI